MNYLENAKTTPSTEEKNLKGITITPLLESIVRVHHPYYGGYKIYRTETIVSFVLNHLQDIFSSDVSSYFGGSAIINLFGGPIYHSVADLDWTIIIFTSSNLPETFLTAQAQVIHSIASLILQPEGYPTEKLTPESIGIKMTTPFLKDGSCFSRFCFQGENSLPLELSLHVRDKPLSRLMYDLYIPLSAFNYTLLGSQTTSQFELRSSDCTDTISIDDVLSNIASKIIIYDPEPNLKFPDRNKWLRLQVAITEGSLAPDSNINATWFVEATEDNLSSNHITEWACYKRKNFKLYPFFLCLTALFNAPHDHPISTEILFKCLDKQKTATPLPFISWVEHLVSLFPPDESLSTIVPPSFHPTILTLFNLFIPYLADEMTLARHSATPHLHLRFGDTPPFFVPVPIQEESKAQLYFQSDIKSLVDQGKFGEAAGKMLESPLITPIEIEALFFLAEKLTKLPFSFDAHIRAALFWKNRNIDLFTLHLTQGIRCEKQDLSPCSSLLKEESNPFLFERMTQLLPLPHALILASHQMTLFGPTLPLAFYRSCIQKGIIDPILEPCLQALEASSPELAWEAYLDFGEVPSLAEAIERKLLSLMAELAKSEPNKPPYLPIIEERLRKVKPRRLFKLALVAKALGAHSSSLQPHILAYFRAFPKEKGLIMDSFPELNHEISQEETRLALLEKKLEGMPLIQALSSCNLGNFSTEELSSLAADIFPKSIDLPFADFNENYPLFLSLLKSLQKSEQLDILPNWTKTVFSHYNASPLQFSSSFWMNLTGIVESKIKEDKFWRKLLITLIIQLSPEEVAQLKILPLLQTLDQATRSISDNMFPALLPKDDLERRQLYYFKAACYLRDAGSSNSFSYLEAMLALPYKKREVKFLTSFGEDPLDFSNSFKKLSSKNASPQTILTLLTYQKVMSSLAELFPYYLNTYNRFSEEKAVINAFKSIIMEIFAGNTSDHLKAQEKAKTYKSCCAEVIKKHFQTPQDEDKPNILKTLESLSGENEVVTFLTERFESTGEIPDIIQEWYCRLSNKITPNLSSSSIHPFVLRFPEDDNRASGWVKFIKDPLSCSSEESQFYLGSASLEEKREFLTKILAAPSTFPYTTLFNFMIPTNYDLEPLLSSGTWTNEALQNGISLVAPRAQGSLSLKSFVSFTLRSISSCLDFREALPRFSSYFDDESKRILTTRYAKECEQDIRLRRNLETHLLFLLKNSVGKTMRKTRDIYPLFLRLSTIVSYPHTRELLKELKAPLKPEDFPLAREELEFKQTETVLKFYLSSNKCAEETLNWLADKIAHSFYDERYRNLSQIIGEKLPGFFKILSEKYISVLDSKKDSNDSLLYFADIYPYILYDQFEFYKKYFSEMDARLKSAESGYWIDTFEEFAKIICSEGSTDFYSDSLGDAPKLLLDRLGRIELSRHS